MYKMILQRLLFYNKNKEIPKYRTKYLQHSEKITTFVHK